MPICRFQLIFIAVVVVLGLNAMLTACGQKGPLYLAEKPAIVDSTESPEKRLDQDDVPAAPEASAADADAAVSAPLAAEPIAPQAPAETNTPTTER